MSCLSADRPFSGFNQKPTPWMPTIEKIFSKCKDIPGFPYLSKSTLCEWCVKHGFATGAKTKKCMCTKDVTSCSNA